MENPIHHPQWQRAVDAALADPETHDRAQQIVDEVRKRPPRAVSPLKQIYDAMVREGLIR